MYLSKHIYNEVHWRFKTNSPTIKYHKTRLCLDVTRWFLAFFRRSGSPRVIQLSEVTTWWPLVQERGPSRTSWWQDVSSRGTISCCLLYTSYYSVYLNGGMINWHIQCIICCLATDPPSHQEMHVCLDIQTQLMFCWNSGPKVLFTTKRWGKVNNMITVIDMWNVVPSFITRSAANAPYFWDQPIHRCVHTSQWNAHGMMEVRHT